MATTATATLILAIKAVDMTAGGMGSVGRNLALLGAGGALLGLTAGAVKAASSFQTMTTQVMNNTTMGTQGMAAMVAGIKQLGAGSAAPLDQLAQGWMHATNLGFTSAQSFQIVKQGMMSALSTGSNVGDTINTLAQVMHEFSAENLTAAQAMDLLHMAAAQGNTTLEQFTAGASGALAMAANAHVPLTQVATDLAALTRHEGIDTASTQIVGMISKIVNPAKAARTELAKLTLQTGVPLLSDFTPEGIKAKGLNGVLADIKKAKLDAAQLFQIVPALRGGLGAEILTGTGSNDVSRIGASLNTVMSGKATPTTVAYTAYTKTLGSALGTLKNDVQLLAISLGNVLLPAVTAGTTALAGFVRSLNPGTLLQLLAVVGGAVGVYVAYRTTMLGVALAQGVWNAAVTVGNGLQAAWTFAVAAGSAVMAVARTAIGLYAAANEAVSLAILAVRLGLVQQAVATAVSAGVTTVARVATTLWAGAQWLLTTAIDAGKASVALFGLVAGGFSLASAAARLASLGWTAAQWLLNVALDANPISLIILGVAGLTAGIIWAWQNVGWFREIVMLAWSALQIYLTPGVWAITEAFKLLGPVITNMGTWLKGILGDAFTFVTDTIKNLLTELGNFLTMAEKIPGIANVITPVLKALKEGEKLATTPTAVMNLATNAMGAGGAPPTKTTGPTGAPPTMTAAQIAAFAKAAGLSVAQLAKDAVGMGMTSAQVASAFTPATLEQYLKAAASETAASGGLTAAQRAQATGVVSPGVKESTVAARTLADNIKLLTAQYKQTLNPATLAAYTADVQQQLLASGISASLAQQVAQYDTSKLQASATKGTPEETRNLTAQIKLLTDQYKTTLNPATLAAYTADVQQQLVNGGVTATLAKKLATQDALNLSNTAAKAATAKVVTGAPREAIAARGIYGTQQRVTPGAALSPGTTVAAFGAPTRNTDAKVIAALQSALSAALQQVALLQQQVGYLARMANSMDRAANNMSNPLRAAGIPFARAR